MSPVNAQLKIPDGAPVEEEIIQRAKRSYERLPILEVILERFALAVGPALKHYIGAICEARIDNIEYMPVGEALEANMDEAKSTKLIWRPQNTIEMDEDKAGTLLKLLDALDDSDDVQSFYGNYEISDDVMEKLDA